MTSTAPSKTAPAAPSKDAPAAAAPAAAAAAPSKNGPGELVTRLSQSDAQLKENKTWQALHGKYSAPASDATVQAAAKNISAKGFHAIVVDDAKGAIDAVAALIPNKASVGFGYSTTFNEIGLTDYFKSRTDLHNFREIALAADGKGDRAAGMAARMQGLTADWFLTSANAIAAETGEIVIADASGTRVPGIMTAKNAILVLGANKLVNTGAEAITRLEQYVLPVESARIREVYKMPASVINFLTVAKGASPYSSGKIYVVIINGHSYGF